MCRVCGFIHTGLEAWTNGGHTFYNWPLRGQHTADVPVPENQETFPLLTLPHVEKCTLAMNTANPDNALPAWEEYNLNFGMLFNKRILVPRIVKLKSFTGWFWVAHSQLILNFERHILRALANIYPIKPHTRHITLYFTPSYPSWPTSCTHTLPRVPALLVGLDPARVPPALSLIHI